nr:uncharacterized protein LOC104100708 [Nicotiana tomentosiformis]
MNIDVRLDSQVILKRGSFKYLGSFIQENEEIDEDVTHHIGAGQMKWRVLASQKLSYSEYESSRDEILRRMCGHTRLDNIRNDDIRVKVGMAPVEDKMQEPRIRLTRHVERRSIDAPVRMCERLLLLGMGRGIRMPKKYWREVIRQDMARL